MLKMYFKYNEMIHFMEQSVARWFSNSPEEETRILVRHISFCFDSDQTKTKIFSLVICVKEILSFQFWTKFKLKIPMRVFLVLIF